MAEEAPEGGVTRVKPWTFTTEEVTTRLYIDTPTKNMAFAMENVDKILWKLQREGRVTAYSDRSKTKVEPVPEFGGYLRHQNPEIVWELAEQTHAQKEEHTNFIE